MELPFECGTNVANQDESTRAFKLGQSAFFDGNIERAEKLLKKSLQLYEIREAKELYLKVISMEKPPSNEENISPDERNSTENVTPEEKKSSWKFLERLTSVFRRKQEEKSRAYEPQQKEDGNDSTISSCTMTLHDLP
jgi:hypothetical protein